MNRVQDAISLTVISFTIKSSQTINYFTSNLVSISKNSMDSISYLYCRQRVPFGPGRDIKTTRTKTSIRYAREKGRKKEREKRKRERERERERGSEREKEIERKRK